MCWTPQVCNRERFRWGCAGWMFHRCRRPLLFQKSLQIDHARDGEVMIAYEMNGEPLPMLNGYPIHLIVPGWFATYWVEARSSITVLDQPLKTFGWTRRIAFPTMRRLTKSRNSCRR